MSWLLLATGILWVLFNIAAPYSVMFKAQKLSRGRLPAELLIWPKDRKVQFYIMDLQASYGYSVWAPPFDLVVFDKTFFKHASPTLIRYVVAHELAHFTAGHHKKRWWMVVTGLVVSPLVRRWIARMEDEADNIARQRTGLDRKMFPELLS